MSHSIVYGSWTFTADKIKSGNLYLAASLLASSLEVNSFAPVVECDDPTILDFQRNAKLLYYAEPGRSMVFRVQNITRIGPKLYEISSTSTLGLLTEGQHMGGIYTGQEAEAVILDICGTVPVEIKNVLKKIKLYGWLPIAVQRDNLAQVLFAIGATLKTDLDGVLRIEGLWDGISGSVPQDNIYTDANVDYSARITQVIVIEHQYVPWTETKQLFEGTAQAGDVITFDEPMHSLNAQGFSILASGANWARVSAGSGTLTGKTYLHNTRQISKAVQAASTPNVKTVEDATLVSLVNSTAVAERLADYYRCRERVDAAVVYQGESPGDRLATYHPFDKIGVSACLESADITLSNTLKAQEKLLVGYVPPQMGEVEYFDHSEAITRSMTWPIPEGVTAITAVCIGGGQGGQRGGNGSAGGDGTDAHTQGNLSKPTSLEQGKPGTGGSGGSRGSGGSGGRIYTVNINVTGLSSLTITIGYGGSANGGSGGETVIVAGSARYSSNSGSVSSSGYTDIITGRTYATPGSAGSYNGGKGGDGVSGTSGSGGTGDSVGSYSGGAGNRWAYNQSGILYTLPAGGGAAAYGGNGGAATDTCNGGAGGNAVQNRGTPSTPGCGGHGGNGGGGGGGGGAGYIDSSGVPERHYIANGGKGGAGGSGSSGTAGAPGIVLLAYRQPKKSPAGQLVDKNNKMVLDRLGRRIIM